MKSAAALALAAVLLASVPARAAQITDDEVKRIASRYAFEPADTEPAKDPVREAIAAQDLRGIADAIGTTDRLDAPDASGQTPLMIAVTLRKPKSVKFLLERGAHASAEGARGATPLLLAAERGHTAIAQTLLAEGAEVDMASDDGITPLIASVIHQRYATAEALLASGANANHKMKGGLSPYDFAKVNDNPDLVKLLQRYGAKPSDAGDVLETTLE